MTHAASSPPAAEPSVKPQNIVVTSSERHLAGAYSAISAVALGIAAPSPMPVRKRSAVSAGSEPANPDAKHQKPNVATDATISIRLPTRSATGPAIIEPTAYPTSAAPSVGPSASRDTWNVLTSIGATKPINAVSSPSSAAMRKQSASTRHW